ncbi:hypothetical protein ACFYY8_34775 [Streptosporangium sp. NPDC001559]|uniref:hypothetical protein n=1 Tax=Streptosporangium sp. NPDC001559 TaxID=3366187 RepID=UPI0036EE359B
MIFQGRTPEALGRFPEPWEARRQVNRSKARAIAVEKLEHWAGEPAPDVRERLLGRSVRERYVDEQGKTWMVVARAFWQDEAEGEMRVVVHVDDGGLLSSLFPESRGDVIRV